VPAASAREQPVGRVVVVMTMALAAAALAAPTALALVPSSAVARVS
jgi:hypothetical protein